VEHADDLAIGNRHDRPVRATREHHGALVGVDRWLGRDPIAFLSYRSEKLCHRPRVTSLCWPDLELRHRHMLASLPNGPTVRPSSIEHKPSPPGSAAERPCRQSAAIYGC
jgi:hypothetical protein